MYFVFFFFFFKQKTAYEIGWCDWRSDVCSSDLITLGAVAFAVLGMTVVPYLLYYGRYKTASTAARRSGFMSDEAFRVDLWRKRGLEALAMTVALATSGVLLYLLAVKVFDDPIRPTPQLAKLPPVL